jgi:integrase
MSLQLAATLREHLRRRKEETLKKGWSEVPEWAFRDTNGNALDGNKHFAKALAKAGLRRIRIHDLRHTYVSLLIQNGRKPGLRERSVRSSLHPGDSRYLRPFVRVGTSALLIDCMTFPRGLVVAKW